MATLRKDLEYKMEKAQDAIRVYSWVDDHYPDLLDLDVYYVWAYGFGSIELIADKGTKGFAAKVASILGIEDSFEKEHKNGYEITTHTVDAEGFGFMGNTMRIKTKVPNGKGCKKYRVVKEYETETCGGPPNGEGILEVEELE